MTAAPARRSGSETRDAIQRVALELFTSRGYESTSMREIAEALDIRKASIYYHFAGKEDILRSLFDRRSQEAEELLDWIRGQDAGPGLARAAVLRWIDSFSSEKLSGIRFLSANPLLVRTIAARSGERIGTALGAVVDALIPSLPDRSPVPVLHLRMALLSINAALEAANDETAFTDDQILAAARRAADALMDTALAPGTTGH